MQGLQIFFNGLNISQQVPFQDQEARWHRQCDMFVPGKGNVSRRRYTVHVTNGLERSFSRPTQYSYNPASIRPFLTRVIKRDASSIANTEQKRQGRRPKCLGTHHSTPTFQIVTSTANANATKAVQTRSCNWSCCKLRLGIKCLRHLRVCTWFRSET